MEKIKFIVAGGMRLDKLISENTELSRSAAARLIEQGSVLVDGSCADKKDCPRAGAEV